jgi:4-amino-4-deoxychorismate lyase
VILLNGETATAIDALDRGLHYGDGLFETIAILEGMPLLWERHMARLRDGCARLRLPMPDGDLLRAEVLRVTAGATKSTAKILVTRGAGGRGYRPPAAVRPTRLVLGYPWPDYPEEHRRTGVTVRLCHTRLARNPALAGLKHLNRMEQVLARAEWSDEEVAEGLMQDTDGNLIEGTMSNLFLVQGGALFTPALDQSGVAGVMRAQILETAAALGVSCRVTTIPLAEAKSAEALFLSNSLFGIWPVRRWEERHYPAHPTVQRLQQRLLQEHACA